MGEVQTRGPDHSTSYLLQSLWHALLVDLLGEGSRHRRSRFPLTSLFSLAQFRATLRELCARPNLIPVFNSGFRPQASYKAKRALSPTERAGR